jgi:hypothetical protein
MTLDINLLRPRQQAEEMMDAAVMFPTMVRGCAERD